MAEGGIVGLVSDVVAGGQHSEMGAGQAAAMAHAAHSTRVAEMSNHLAALGGHLAAAARAMLADAVEAPGRFPQAANLLTDNGELGSWAFVLGALGAVLLGALAVAWLVYRLLRPVRRRLANANADSAAGYAVAALQAVIVDLAPPLAYAVAAMTGSHVLLFRKGLLFSGTDVFQTVANAAVAVSATAWLVVAAVGVPLAVGRPGLRALPLGDEDAQKARRFLVRVVGIGAGSWLLAESLYVAWIGDGLPRLVLIAAGIVIAVSCLRALRRVAPLLRGVGQIWRAVATVSVFGLLGTWIVGLLIEGEPPFSRVLGTLGVLVALPALDGMLVLLLGRVRRRMQQAKGAVRTIFVPTAVGDGAEVLTAVERPVGSSGETNPEIGRSLDAFIEVLHDAAYLFITFLAVMVLGHAWQLELAKVLGPHDNRTMLGSLFDAGVTLLVGWYAWRIFAAGLAVRLSRESGGSENRARTVQPLLRGVAMIVIGSVALMGALSSLGINIAPLIASAGVVGIAVGFGAQTLVRDLFSGACYLVEDVFRIGDYIEAGQAKGTVEKITFRTVALRHQNGPLHFVPYGSLGSVRNNSRDWVIDKFELPLPVDTDSEKIRRMIKRIGQEMLDEPALAEVIMMPLKAKLYRIEPGAKIFRCKVQTPPGKQFEVRSEAYRRIEAALAEAGIPFANNIPQVTVHNSLPPYTAPMDTIAAA